MQESRSKQSTALDTIKWGNINIDIKHEKVKSNLANAVDSIQHLRKLVGPHVITSDTLEENHDAIENVLTQILVSFDDAEVFVRNEILKLVIADRLFLLTY